MTSIPTASSSSSPKKRRVSSPHGVVVFYSKSADCPPGSGPCEYCTSVDSEVWWKWAVGAYEPEAFRKKLSNFDECGFLFEGQYWPSIEHAFQAYKFLVNLDTLPALTREMIVSDFSRAETAADAKRMWKYVVLTKAQIAKWDGVSRRYMARFAWAKYYQNVSRGKALLATGSAVLLHFSRGKPHDRFEHLELVRDWLARGRSYESGDAFLERMESPPTVPWRLGPDGVWRPVAGVGL